MQRLLTICLLLLLPLLVGATEYIGTLTIGESLRLDKTRVEVLPTENGQCSLLLHKVKFSRWMPVRVNVEIPNVSDNDGSLSLEREIPLMNGDPYPKKPASNLKGQYTRSRLRFTLTLGKSTVRFDGQKK